MMHLRSTPRIAPAFLLVSLIALFSLLAPAAGRAAGIGAFIGDYEGEATVLIDGETLHRDLSVTIKAEDDDGFTLSWTTATLREDGRRKEKRYTITFLPSARQGIYQSAMKTNLFGKATPLDPLQGEPFVWARIEEDTLSVFSLFIDPTGDYEVQEYHRTLAPGGLELMFRRIRDGEAEREISTLLRRRD
ncbi:hypothetical protein FIU94_02995 [Sulfitobacter sp. THAF37]|uniref:hypothetical protein n=1 Tax=Sulfitobacter sp. THAF37 TaxID=2587855 RepID=UPI0012A96B6C|nr:hypothetical protein [Sulfitobacter sp. THAF37]QFT57780.1 hypothetical protein FIU94_02995 [Sulfitobacter sp. THAF37]